MRKRQNFHFEFSRKSPVLWLAFLSVLVFYTWAYSYLGAILILEKNTVRTGQPQAGFITRSISPLRSAAGAMPVRLRSLPLLRGLSRNIPTGLSIRSSPGS